MLEPHPLRPSNVALRWGPALIGALAGLGITRVALESLGWPWALPFGLLVGLGARQASRLHRTHLLLLVPPALYVFYPGFAPWLGLRLILLAGLFWAALRLGDRRWRWLSLAVALAGLILYVTTLVWGPLPADSGEFQLVAATLGIAHPPGYPLYTLLAHSFTYLPLADTATRVSLFSALLAGGTLGLVAAAVPTLAGGLLAAAALAAVPTFWAQAVTANIRALIALFSALLLYLALGPKAPSRRRLLSCAGVSALALGHHPSLLAVVLPAGLYLLSRTRHPPWGTMALAFALGLTPLLYLPLRSLMEPAFDPVPIRSVEGFFNHFLAQGFQGELLRPSMSQIPDRLRALWQILAFEAGPWLALGALLGLVAARWRGLVLAAIFVIIAALALSYRAPQTVEYLMPGWVALALLVGYLPGALPTAFTRPGRAFLIAALLLVALTRLAWLYPNFVELRQQEPTRAAELLAAAPRGATLLASWHLATPLWYLQEVGGLRPDVEVAYVYPQGATPYPQTWLRRVGEALENGPLVVTNRYAVYGQLPVAFAPAGPGLQVLVSGDRLWAAHVLGDRLAISPRTTDGLPNQVRAGGELSVDLALQPLQALGEPVATFVHLVGSDGRPVAQKDISHVFSRTDAEIVRHTLPVPYSVPPGAYRLIAGAYVPSSGERLQSPGGADHLDLGQIEVLPAPYPPATLHPEWTPFGGRRLVGRDAGVLHWAVAGGYQSSLWEGEPVPGPARGPWGLTQAEVRPAPPPELYVPFGGKLTLVGVAHERVGDDLRVRLTWLGNRPLWGEYNVSLKAVGQGWLAQHDGTPLSGMVPTTKWLRGARFEDLHILELPPQARQESFDLTLTVYDAFTLEQLPVLDPRLQEAGQGEVVTLTRIEGR